MTDSMLEANPLALVEQEVARVIEDLDLHSYYQLLEVQQLASGAQITAHHEIMTQHYGQIATHPACSSGLRSNLMLIRARLDEALQILSDPRLRVGYDQRLELGETRVALRQTPTGTFSLDDFDQEMGVTPPREEPEVGLEVSVNTSAPEPSPEPPPPRATQRGPAPLRKVGYPTPEESFTDEVEPTADRSSVILRRFMQAVGNVVDEEGLVLDDDTERNTQDDTERMVGLPIPPPRREGD
jgi:hypothetical protein